MSIKSIDYLNPANPAASDDATHRLYHKVVARSWDEAEYNSIASVVSLIIDCTSR